MTFTVQTMLGDTALVSGTDLAGNTGKQIVSTLQWEELKQRENFSSAKADFDAEVESFFAPITEAADKLKATVAAKAPDSAAYIVLTEGTEGVKAKPANVVQLSRDSIILRLIEEDNTDRLIWVDEHTLGILAS